MKRTICFSCQKGGVAKTTTATTIAGALTKEGKKVVLVDLDQQANSTKIFLSEAPEHTITEVLEGKTEPLQAIQTSDFGDILPSDEFLKESSITTLEQLQRIVDALQKRYSYVIFDCPPNLGKLTVSAMIVSDYVIVCTTASPMGYDSCVRTMETIDGVREAKNPKLKVGGILPVMTTRATLTRAFLGSLQSIADGYNTTCFDSIRQGISIPESQLMHKPIFDYAPKSNQAVDYMRFYNQLKEKGIIKA